MLSMDDNGRDTATRLLQHYFRLVAEGAGIQWVNDNDVEVAQIVDALLNAARLDAMQELLSLLQRQRDALLEEKDGLQAENNALRSALAKTKIGKTQ